MGATVTVGAKELAKATCFVLSMAEELERCGLELKALGGRMEASASKLKAQWLEAVGVTPRPKPLQKGVPPLAGGAA